MSLVSILITILIGALIGWLASIIMKSSHGFIMSCVIGIVGSFIGGFLASLIGLGGGNSVVTILIDIAGACILIALLRFILGKKW